MAPDLLALDAALAAQPAHITAQAPASERPAEKVDPAESDTVRRLRNLSTAVEHAIRERTEPPVTRGTGRRGDVRPKPLVPDLRKESPWAGVTISDVVRDFEDTHGPIDPPTMVPSYWESLQTVRPHGRTEAQTMNAMRLREDKDFMLFLEANHLLDEEDPLKTAHRLQLLDYGDKEEVSRLTVSFPHCRVLVNCRVVNPT